MKPTFVLPVSALIVLLAACGPQPQAPASPEAAASPAASATDTAPAAAVAAQADAAAPAPATEANAGQTTYNRSCSICHATGTAGAPKPGDKADWEPRLAQGVDVLYKHAIEGFTGSKGVMPPRGGAGNLGDDEIKVAVDYMLSFGG